MPAYKNLRKIQCVEPAVRTLARTGAKGRIKTNIWYLVVSGTWSNPEKNPGSKLVAYKQLSATWSYPEKNPGSKLVAYKQISGTWSCPEKNPGSKLVAYKQLSDAWSYPKKNHGSKLVACKQESANLVVFTQEPGFKAGRIQITVWYLVVS